MALVLAFDAGWGGCGWALCTANKPVRTGHAAPGNKSWRMVALRSLLHDLEHDVADLSAHLAPGDPPPRVVIEKAPKVYAGRGNQAATGWGMGEIAGAIELWGCRPTWSHPWLVLPDVWRHWWWPKPPKAHNRLKAKAIEQVRLAGWGDHIAGMPLHRDPGDWKGAGVDLAEAILIGMGAARRLGSPMTPKGEAPRGPVAWERARADGSAYLGAPHQPELLPPTRRPT